MYTWLYVHLWTIQTWAASRFYLWNECTFSSTHMSSCQWNCTLSSTHILSCQLHKAAYKSSTATYKLRSNSACRLWRSSTTWTSSFLQGWRAMSRMHQLLLLQIRCVSDQTQQNQPTILLQDHCVLAGFFGLDVVAPSLCCTWRPVQYVLVLRTHYLYLCFLSKVWTFMLKGNHTGFFCRRSSQLWTKRWLLWMAAWMSKWIMS